MSAPEILSARKQAELARRNFLSTAGELQRRLKPSTIASNAWEGVTDKAADVADGAVEAVKSRPVAASAAVGALTLFLARQPIRSVFSWLFTRKPDANLVTTRLDNTDGQFDITAPIAERTSEGASA
ncbi:MAG TPA: hypothetical protein VIA98_12125 [Allosphingosinicella sp.]|jgi:hypothetical protein